MIRNTWRDRTLVYGFQRTVVRLKRVPIIGHAIERLAAESALGSGLVVAKIDIKCSGVLTTK
jgi:hypothetical protein